MRFVSGIQNLFVWCCLMLTWCFLVACHQKTHESAQRYPTLSYTELQNKAISLPYIYSCGEEKQLLVFGSNHTMDPKDPQIADIERRIITFKPDLLLYEGDGISFEKSRATTIQQYFEMGFILYLADSLKIPVRNIEPPTRDKYIFLLKQFPKNEVLLATLGLQITMMQLDQPDFATRYPAMVNALVAEGFPMEEEERSIDYFYRSYEAYFNEPFSYETFDSRNVQAKYSKTSLNKVNQAANSFRDQYIIGLVENELKTNDKIYLQIGGWHAIVCEPALRQITKGLVIY